MSKESIATATVTADAGRARALEYFRTHGLPDMRAEDWRYTNLDPVRERLHAWGEQPAKPDGAPVHPPELPGWDGPSLVFTDGTPGPLPATLPAGLALSVTPAYEAALDEDDGEAVPAFNRAFVEQALQVRVAAGAAVAEPFRLVHRATGLHRPAHARLRLDLAENSRLDLFVLQDCQPESLITSVSEITVGRGASLRLLRLQQHGDDVMQLEWTRIRLARDARLEVVTLDLGGRLVRHELRVCLDGEGAAADVRGVFIAGGRQHMDNHLRVDHRTRNTTSEEVFRGVVDGSARGVFNGKVVVHPGAGGSSAMMTNRNLLLSRTAEIDTRPELEISVDDVKCSHGATTGQLDPAALFYLQSRGIARQEAERVLVSAFAAEVVNGIALPAVRELASRAVSSRLAADTGTNPGGV